jgi:hypothetical protein
VRLDSVCKSAQPGTTLGIGAAHTVVDNLDGNQAVRAGNIDAH